MASRSAAWICGRIEQRVQPVGRIDQRVQAADRHGQRAVLRRPDRGRELRHQARHESTARQRPTTTGRTTRCAPTASTTMPRASRASRSSSTTMAIRSAGPVYMPKIYDGQNRTFFFHNMERTTLKDYNQTAFGTLPTPAFKQGDFSRLLNSGIHRQQPRPGRNVGTDAAGRPVRFGAIYDPATARQVGEHLGPRRVSRQRHSAEPLQPGRVKDPGAWRRSTIRCSTRCCATSRRWARAARSSRRGC